MSRRKLTIGHLAIDVEGSVFFCGFGIFVVVGRRGYLLSLDRKRAARTAPTFPMLGNGRAWMVGPLLFATDRRG